MSSPLIRSARRTDESALARIDHATWSTLHAVAPRPSPDQPFFDERHGTDEYLVAEVDGEVAGYIRVVPPTPLPSNAHVRQIQGIAVADSARGKGVARALIRAACDWALDRGARRMTLRVLGHNTPARRLYESEGFRVEGVLPQEFLLGGTYVDDVLMGRTLDA
ncbi:GNAT family N-acetyltransferase [Streptomyces sp. KLOTTS4A1]|uniref:GNAT family N-acetyltransferase n=1 Tax=Streptomyces sp. KLOTTS4A1 TaxID=3390996 RepID=UPI0039F497D9